MKDTARDIYGGELVLEGTEWDDVWVECASDKKTKRILMIGDSITRGFRAKLKENISPDALPNTVATSKSVDNPLFIWYMNPEYDKTAKWTLYDLQAALQQSGWMVPAYTMPKAIEDMVVMRVVVRQGMTRDMADMLLGDIENAVKEFDKLKYPTTSRLTYEKREKQFGKVFTH